MTVVTDEPSEEVSTTATIAHPLDNSNLIRQAPGQIGDTSRIWSSYPQSSKGVGVVKTLSAAELRDLPTAVDIVTAGRAFGIGRTKAHELARAGQFPVPVLRLGNSYRVTRAALLRALGESTTDEPGGTTA
jgi:hypothetical protein